ncbi:MAG: hypothetical protein IJ475_00435 [Bacilli bacterium]|nr:hypothetical protein [Bacilli bacterium]
MFLLDVATTFCKDSAEIWQVVGNILRIFTIVVPILVIIFGMMDLGKAVVASKDDEIKKAIKSLAMRAIAAIVMFFIPSLVGLIMGLCSGFADVKEDYDVCKACITSPSGATCKSAVKTNGN